MSAGPPLWVTSPKLRLGPYARRRVESSFTRVPETLRFCEGLQKGAALDAGCAAGHETFALAHEFEHVLGVDRSRSAIRAARRVARSSGMENVAFRRIDVETARLPMFDLVWSNVMSHNVISRKRLLAHLSSAMPVSAWLYYSEECEGYPVMELGAALERRDAREARARIRQALNGLAGRGFRFYRSGTASPLLEALGFEIRHRQTKQWRGLVYLDQIWCQRVNVVSTEDAWHDGDYLAPSEEHGATLASSRLIDHSPEAFREFGAMAVAAGVEGSESPRLLERIRLRAPRSAGMVDWVGLDKHFRRFAAETLDPQDGST